MYIIYSKGEATIYKPNVSFVPKVKLGTLFTGVNGPHSTMNFGFVPDSSPQYQNSTKFVTNSLPD